MSVDDEWCSRVNRKLWNDGDSAMSWWVVCGAGYMRCHNFGSTVIAPREDEGALVWIMIHLITSTILLTSTYTKFLESDVVTQCKKSNGNVAGGELVATNCGIASGACGCGLGRARGGAGSRGSGNSRAGSTAALRGG